MIYTGKDFSFAHLFLGVRDEKSHPAFLPPNRHTNQFGPPPQKGDNFLAVLAHIICCLACMNFQVKIIIISAKNTIIFGSKV